MRANANKNKRRRTQFGPAKNSKQRLYGAVDLGTNNCRLLIAKPMGFGFRVTSSFSRIVRLGEGLNASGRLSDKAIDRTISALSVCAAKLKELRVVKSRSIATEACRRAENCDAFIDRIDRETGLSFETISYEEEARLALLGCQSLLTDGLPYALVFDIGGGSTELTWARRNQVNGFEILDVLSLPFGVVTLAEGCERPDIDRPEYENMVSEIASHLPPFCQRNKIHKQVGDGQVQMLGTSGTVTTLGAVHLNLPRYSRSLIDGLELDFGSLDRATQMLSRLDYKRRAEVPCIGKERAELVVPGCAILEAIRRSWPVGKLSVADRGLREGMLMELMADDGVPIVGNPAERTHLEADAKPPPNKVH
ncbi:MAG: Ppx/GppA phosphatase family protein [Rhodospirillales bacterium]|jgi:exopolyphosphatase/guanosine-5'-triphosphate,3'-diphosphate pyrophosphatase|nr:Ppx/GppA phosphatase family protein [Rhodospirillales bacterium]MDP6645527.1 Ppx/GppA phosphatase family protein [Rhodospirillales bacterium]MDP6843268.1 Ppx/GppA phosphatase family protein [Rhodospirillales bacterium]|tara:strand:- start:89 stop:1183 length:1095 start_codon:yes stop_codon:yes gene_type:complete